MLEKKMKAHEMLEPMLDLFSGADGGIAFVKLRMLIEEDNEQLNAEIMKFHRLCKFMLNDSET